VKAASAFRGFRGTDLILFYPLLLYSSSAARAVVSAFTRLYIGFGSSHPFKRGNRESEDGQRGQY
jgi:hypothetical protein